MVDGVREKGGKNNGVSIGDGYDSEKREDMERETDTLVSGRKPVNVTCSVRMRVSWP